jgi:hypothetical protein
VGSPAPFPVIESRAAWISISGSNSWIKEINFAHRSSAPSRFLYEVRIGISLQCDLETHFLVSGVRVGGLPKTQFLFVRAQ